MIVRVLRVLNGIFGVGLVGFGVSRFFWSMGSVPGGGVVNATVDSESRAAGPLLVAFGLAYVWAARRAVVPVGAVRFLAVTMGFLALARVVSIVAAGWPNWFFVVAMVVEFAMAVLTWWYAVEARRGKDSGTVEPAPL